MEGRTRSVQKERRQPEHPNKARRKERTDREGHDRSVVEERDDKNHEGREVELKGERHDGESKDDTDGDGAGVDRVVAHPLEDDTRLADGVDDGRKSGLDEDDIGGGTGGVGGTLDGDSDVGAREGRGVVGSVSSHGDEVTELLKALDDLVLVLGEDSSESVGVEDHLVERQVLAALGEASGLEDLGGVHVVSETETTSSLLGDGKLISGDHLDLDSERLSVVDGLLGVLARGVVDGEESDELEAVALVGHVAGGNVLERDGERAETASGKLLDVLLELVLDLGRLVAGAELDDGSGHALGDALHLSSSVDGVGDLGTLVGGVEGLEVEELDTGAGGGRVRDGPDDAATRREKNERSVREACEGENVRVDGVLVLDTASVGGVEHDGGGIERAVGLEGRLVDGELVGRELRRRNPSQLMLDEKAARKGRTVPVLSEQRIVTPASSSMAVIRVTMAWYLASC